jgi:D-serine dehydratase
MAYKIISEPSRRLTRTQSEIFGSKNISNTETPINDAGISLTKRMVLREHLDEQINKGIENKVVRDGILNEDRANVIVKRLIEQRLKESFIIDGYDLFHVVRSMNKQVNELVKKTKSLEDENTMLKTEMNQIQNDKNQVKLVRNQSNFIGNKK